MAGFAEPEFWTAPDGARLAVRRRQAESTRRGTVIVVHGWGDHGGLFGELADWLAARGLDTVVQDQRGAGLSPGGRGHIERFAQYLSDLVALRKHVQSVAPGPQLVLGHSFGALVVLRFLETAPQGLAGAVALAPFVDFAAPPARWKRTLARAVSDVLPRIRISTGLDYAHRTKDRALNTRIYRDPLCHHVMTPRAYLETIKTLPQLWIDKDRIAAPLLVVLAGEDYLVSTPAAREFVKNLSGDVTLAELDGMYHDLLHEPDRDRVYAVIDPWLERVLSAAAAP